MSRVQMRLFGVLVATLLLGSTACNKASHNPRPPTPPANDILGDGVGQFNEALDPAVWHLQAPDGATLAVGTCTGFTTRCATISGADLGQAPYDAQLLLWNGADDAPRYVTLLGGKQYTIKLRASALTAGRTVQVVLEDSLYADVATSTFTLTATPTDYTGEPVVIPTSAGTRDVSVRVNVGGADNAGETLSLDDLFVLEDDAPPPPANDLLAGAGTFDDATAWNWWGPGGTRDTITGGIVTCADLDGACFQISSTDYGTNVWDTALAYWDATGNTFKHLTLKASKQYRIVLRGKESGATTAAGATLHLWLQKADYSFHEFAPVLTGTVDTYTSDPIVVTGATDEDVTFSVDFGTQADHAGVTFSLDDLQIIEEARPGSGTDLLTGGDMESSPGTNLWNRWANDGSNAAFTFADCAADGFTGQCLRVAGSNFGANPWSTQLVYWNGSSDPAFFPLDPAKTYTIKFRGRASADGGTVQVMIQGAAPSYDTPVSHDFPLSTTATDQEYSFQVTAAASLAFKMGFISPAGTTQTFEVDDIQLLEQ
jgi:hypothetical protein